MTDPGGLASGEHLDELHARLSGASTLEIAEELSRADGEAKVVAFRLLDRDRALEVFEALDPPDQQAILEGLRDDRFREVVENMDPDDRARLVGELPAKVAHRVMAGLSERERRFTAFLLGYPPESAGRVMSPEFVALRESMSVREALDMVRRRAHEAETVYTLPVTDDYRRLSGVVSLRQLFLSADAARVCDVMTTEVLTAHVTDDQEAAARLVQEGDLLALPVLDSEDRLVGVLTFDDAMEILEAEETEDLAQLNAHQPLGRPYLSASVLRLARTRAMWLLVLIVAAGLTVNVLQIFEDTLSQVVTLALFIPLLTGTGGNSGAQSSTMVVRAMAVGDLRFGDLPQVAWREIRVGFALGAMLGSAAFVPVGIIWGAEMGTVIGLTIVAICSWAALAGSVLPLLAKRAGVDPAVVSAPLITTLVDATGLVIYFVIARLVLSGL
jgi:magnesium transporter